MVSYQSYYNITYMKKPSKKQRQKNYALMLCVILTIILIYAVTIIKLSN